MCTAKLGQVEPGGDDTLKLRAARAGAYKNLKNAAILSTLSPVASADW
jgi:hypothetical protein